MKHQVAGTLEPSSVFENILSIGYELETHDLIKFSQQEGTNILINSPTTLSTISSGQKDGSVTKINDSSYRIKDSMIEYSEYVDESPAPNVVLNVTNDIGVSIFTEFLKSMCSSLDIPKNNIYTLNVLSTEHADLESSDTQSYNIHFASELNDRNCFSFSGVEWVVTYYNPAPSSDLIMETFLGACDIVSQHLTRWSKSYETAFLANGDDSIGELLLFKNPENNLVYMQTQPYMNNMSHAKSLGQVAIMPQMTFRAKISHMVEIIKQMTINPWLDIPAIRNLTKRYNIIINVESCVREMMDRQQLVNADVFGYLWFILYKIHIYLTVYNFTDKTPDNYFKYHIMFMARKSNIQLYRRLKTVFPNGNGNKDAQILQLVNQPDLVLKYIYTKPDGKIVNKSAVETQIEHTNSSFGDPSVSFASYFQYFNILDDDWLVVNDIDVYTGSGGDGAVFTDDTLLVENRLFYLVFEAYFKTNIHLLNQKFDTLEDMQKLLKKIISNKRDRPMMMTLRQPVTDMKLYDRVGTQIVRRPETKRNRLEGGKTRRRHNQAKRTKRRPRRKMVR